MEADHFLLAPTANCLLVGIFLSRPLAPGSKLTGEIRGRIGEYLLGLGLGLTEPLADPMALEDAH